MAGMGDLKVAEAQQYAEAHARIRKACDTAFGVSENRANCSGFVKAVASDLGIPIQGQANDIYDQIQKDPWRLLGRGDTGATAAVYAARQGFLVVAAWKNDEGNGHVAVVTDWNALGRTGAPTSRNVLASWGVLKLPDKAQNHGLIRESFDPKKKLPDVIFASRYIAKFR
jgi:hypothetical protein